MCAKFNHAITDKLLEGAIAALTRHGVKEDAIDTVRVPGAFELPVTANRIAASGKVDAIVALGAVIRGGTPHFEYVCQECARGIMDVGLSHDFPVIFGVLTTDDLSQAVERTGGTEGHKGEEAAIAAMEMVSLLRSFKG